MNEYNRLPPGQRLLSDPNEFPVLDLGIRPDWNKQDYRLTIKGEVENPVSLSYDEVMQLPQQDFTADFHCVTTWSKFDVKWSGVAWSEIEKLVKPKTTAQFVFQYGLDGYLTNINLSELRKPNVFIALKLDGQPLPSDHGAPMRIIIPQLYGWKGSKFLTAIEFSSTDKPGFWEVRGYHNHGDPWKQERYS